MRRTVCWLLALVLLWGIAGCTNEYTAAESTIQPTQETEPSETQLSTEETAAPTEETTEPTLPPKTEEELREERIRGYIDRMRLEEQVAQLFVVNPEVLDGSGVVTKTSDEALDFLSRVPVGGIVYMGSNLLFPEQTKAMLQTVQEHSLEQFGLPLFLCVDEEGGTVARISGSGRFSVPVIGDMRDVSDVQEALEIGRTMGTYLRELGFNVDFAPVADVLSNPDNQVVRRRSFGADPQKVAELAMAVGEGLMEQGVFAVYKHFPGHGSTAGDSHYGYAYTDKTLQQLESCDLLPFQLVIENGAAFVMVGHIALPQVTGEDVPASMSHTIITELLREQMGYRGIVITDSLAMGAVTQHYAPGEAAVQTILAGSDLILVPQDFQQAYDAVLEAVRNGTISQERLEQSLMRILYVKLQMLQ